MASTPADSAANPAASGSPATGHAAAAVAARADTAAVSAAPSTSVAVQAEEPAESGIEYPFAPDALDAASTVGLPIPLAPAQAISRPCVLQQIRGPLAPQVIELDRDTLIVGRAEDVDIKVPSSALSRRHVRLERYQGSYRVIDLDSSNGVYLNEIRVHSAVLRDSDTLQLGNAVFIYHEGK
jgi:hypothetical protein